MCPLLPTVQWDGMDTWDWGTVHGTAWDSHSVSITSHGTVGWDSLGVPSVSITSHGTVGWDGHLGLGCCAWDSLKFPQCVHSNPQYSGMGWNGHLMGFPQCVHSNPQYRGMGWNGHLLGFPQCVHYFSHGGTVGWDGHLSDSWECPKNIKTIWDSHCTIGHLLAMLDMNGGYFLC